MEEQEWIDKLKEEEVEEFTFFPKAFTRMEKELEIELPDLDFDTDDKKDESKKDSSTAGSTVKTITLTIGGIAIGVAVGASAATLLTPPVLCPLPQTASQTQTSAATTQTPRQPVLPSSGAVQSSSATPAPGTR